ncbi:uncharacterized protein EAF01_005406 [Botrytis porri]|uniref:uncharacterized protein n=1 Tax=Botrytis porri TaxID=87229 RepID=UPI001902C125|nr:uncharacterized protein EAF01_005406 [Botrytis porri]KAF7904884.1 hypothetical protein EAF01_005406 [Botrytis porri]
MTSRVFELVSRDPGTSSHFVSIIPSWTKETGGTSTLPVSKLAMVPLSQHFHIVNPPRIEKSHRKDMNSILYHIPTR